ESRDPKQLKVGDTIRFGPFLLRLTSWIDPEPVVQRMPDAEALLQSAHHDGPLVLRHVEYPVGVPRDQSNWLKYLPEIFSNDEFLGRYLLIFESLLSPIMWTVDNFDLFLSPEVAPAQWLQWMTSWFDLLLLPELPIERQRL